MTTTLDVGQIQRHAYDEATEAYKWIDATRINLGYQQLTSLSSAASLTVPTGAKIAVIVPETQAVRWRDDGTSPTASVGMPLSVGTYFVFTGNLSAIKFIEQTASAKLNVSYYK